MIRVILVGTMQQIRVEIERITRFHFDIDKFQTLEDLIHALPIGTSLFPSQHMLYAAKMM